MIIRNLYLFFLMLIPSFFLLSDSNDLLLKPDYEKNLLIGNYFVGNYNLPIIKPSSDFNKYFGNGWLWVEKFENDFGDFSEDDEKGFYPHIVNGGEGLFIVASIKSSINPNIKDLYYFNLKSKNITRLTKGISGFMIFRDYNQHSDLVLYSITNISDKTIELNLVNNTNQNEETIDIIDGRLGGACFINDEGDIFYFYIDGLNNRHYFIYNRSMRTIESIRTDWATKDKFLYIKDVNYTSKKILLGRWNNNLSIFDIENKSMYELLETENYQSSLFSPDGKYISFIDLKEITQNNKKINYVQLGTFNIKSKKKNTVYDMTGYRMEPYIFWLSNDEIGFALDIDNNKQMYMYKSDYSGKNLFPVKLPNDFKLNRLMGQNMVTSYGKACPQIYSMNNKGENVFIDEIIKEAKGYSNKKEEKLRIPINKINIKAPVIILTDKLREKSFIEKIEVFYDDKSVAISLQGDVNYYDKYLVVEQGDIIKIILPQIDESITDVFLSIKGYYIIY